MVLVAVVVAVLAVCVVEVVVMMVVVVVIVVVVVKMNSGTWLGLNSVLELRLSRDVGFIGCT